MEQEDNKFIGTGWGFPPTFKKEQGGVVMTSGVKDIENSLRILLTTELKERVMQPKYGCNMQSLLFEPISLTLITMMKTMVKDAIVFYEPRIKLLDLVLEANTNEGIITIRISYEVRGTNSRYNYVYPFYINEGTQIKT
jgi:phage baseplate assembly protein W